MVKEVNPAIHVNERDYPVDGHHCDDPEKAKLVKKLAVMITDNIPRKLPGGMKENHMDFWILDRLLTKEEVKFMLSFKKRRFGLTTPELAERNGMSEEEAQKIIAIEMFKKGYEFGQNGIPAYKVYERKRPRIEDFVASLDK